MDRISLNLYSYNKRKGFIPLDSNNKSLYKNKIEYISDIKFLYYYLGLEPEFKKIKGFKEKVDIFDCSEMLGKYYKKYYSYQKFTGKCSWLGENYIYIKIRDENKLNWNTVLRFLKVKKNTGAFFIYNYQIKRSKPVFYKKILALPCSYITNETTNNIERYYNGNLQILTNINPINWNNECKDVFTNKTFQLYELIDLVQHTKKVDLSKLDKYIESHNIYRDNEYFFNKGFDTHECEESNFKLFQELFNIYDMKTADAYEKVCRTNFIYKTEWFIHNIEEFKPKCYQIIPNLIRTLKYKYNYNELKETIYHIILFYLCKDELDMINKPNLVQMYKIYNYIFEFCYANQKDLSLKVNKHISNMKELRPIDIVNIDMYIVPKSLTNFRPYKLDKNYKQWCKLASYLAKEIYGKCIYDSKHKRHYKSNNSVDMLDKHISNSFISDKEFLLIIDEFKTNNPDITINPSANLKYDFLKSLGFIIDDEYNYKVCGKTIVNPLERLKSILYKNLSLIRYIIKDRFYIIIYVKKINDYLDTIIKSYEDLTKNSHKTDPPDDRFN